MYFIAATSSFIDQIQKEKREKREDISVCVMYKVIISFLKYEYNL